MRHKTNMVLIHHRDGSLIGEFPGEAHAEIESVLARLAGLTEEK